MHARESGQAAVAAREFHGYEASRRGTHLPVRAVADEPELSHPAGQLERELRALPVARDDGQHFVADERPGAVEILAFLLAELVTDANEVRLQCVAEQFHQPLFQDPPPSIATERAGARTWQAPARCRTIIPRYERCYPPAEQARLAHLALVVWTAQKSVASLVLVAYWYGISK